MLILFDFSKTQMYAACNAHFIQLIIIDYIYTDIQRISENYRCTCVFYLQYVCVYIYICKCTNGIHLKWPTDTSMFYAQSRPPSWSQPGLTRSIATDQCITLEAANINIVTRMFINIIYIYGHIIYGSSIKSSMYYTYIYSKICIVHILFHYSQSMVISSIYLGKLDHDLTVFTGIMMNEGIIMNHPQMA